MASLEIRTPDGRTEVRRLSRRTPVIVGRNPVSDVAVEDDSVAPVHCRLSWNGRQFEVAAVVAEGVDVNGVLVRKKELLTGDVIRVGPLDLVLLNGSGDRVKAAAPGASVERPPGAAEASRAEAAGGQELEVLSIDGPEVLGVEMPVMAPVDRPKPVKTDAEVEATGRAIVGTSTAVDGGAETSGSAAAEKDSAAERKEVKEKPEAEKGKPGGSAPRRRRPGEQEAVRSPLVLGLGGLSLLLLLAATAIWLLIGREGADRLYRTANEDRDGRRFVEAIAGYELFLKEHANDSRADDVRYELGRTRVERHAAGASPDWEKALDEFDRFAQASRDEPDFDKRRDLFAKLAESISAGAAADAKRRGDRGSLAAAAEGRKRFDRYAPADGSARLVRGRLEARLAEAEAAVRKREYFDDAATKMAAAVAGSDLDAAFEARERLLIRYPDLVSDGKVARLLGDALDAERRLTKPLGSSDLGAPSGEIGDRSSAHTLVGHTQARAGEVSDGRLVFAIARDALVALDAVTGRPRWRRPVGLDPPFFPVEVQSAVPAVLTFDSGRNDLLLLRREDGEPVWRVGVGGRVVGAPLVTQGQVDVATAGGRLLRFSLEGGETLAGVSFPQGVVGPPVLAGGGERLVVFGDRATAYTLDLRSLEVRAVSFTGQAPGAIDAPPTAVGAFVLLCENDRLDSSVVRVFAVDGDGTLRQVAAERVQGRVREPAVVRGNVLFVPSSPERVTVFSVSDDPGQPPLTRLADLQIPGAQDVPTFLVAGPDGMLWEAGTALRKLRLGPKGLELMPGTLATGRHTQPPQESGDSLFVARSLASSPAVYVSQADRETMTGSWRTVLGGNVLSAATGGGSATVVTDSGQAAVLPSRIDGHFVDTKPLPGWDEASPEPLQGVAIERGRVAAWRGGPSPALWLVRAGEEPSRPRSPSAPLECAPAALTGGVALPMPGRIEWLPDGDGPADPFQLPQSGDAQANPKWASIVGIDEERLAAVDDAGALRVLALRREPRPHLAETATVSLGGPAARPLAATGGKIVVASSDGRLRLLDPAGLRPVAEATAGAPITGGPWVAAGALFVQTESRDVVAFDPATLAERWRLTLDAPCAGGPARAADGWIVASQTGTVATIADDGTAISSEALHEVLSGVCAIGGRVYALSLGGALLPLGAAGEEAP